MPRSEKCADSLVGFGGLAVVVPGAFGPAGVALPMGASRAGGCHGIGQPLQRGRFHRWCHRASIKQYEACRLDQTDEPSKHSPTQHLTHASAHQAKAAMSTELAIVTPIASALDTPGTKEGRVRGMKAR